jgi:hypothetical protein
MEYFYWMVWIIGFLICIGVVILYKLNKVDMFIFKLFWIGCLIGMTWELPLSLANVFSIYPPASFITPLPISVPFSTLMIIITHSFWDGALFLLGMGFVKILCKKEHFVSFKMCELGIFLLYGQISELIVELASTYSNAWEYNAYLWNPLLFVFNRHNITLLPQLIWLVAPVIFYYFVLKLKRS